MWPETWQGNSYAEARLPDRGHVTLCWPVCYLVPITRGNVSIFWCSPVTIIEWPFWQGQVVFFSNGPESVRTYFSCCDVVVPKPVVEVFDDGCNVELLVRVSISGNALDCFECIVIGFRHWSDPLVVVVG